MHEGCCHLIGAGPGDPGLITRRGWEILRQADVVYHDALLDPGLLRDVPAHAECVDVGKRAGAHTVAQDEINRLLIRDTRAGLCVVRLKGGDPFVFGRGGEEAEALTEAGCRFEVVPGVTAGVAACAYAGIPVTHRGVSTGVTLVTGHEDPTKLTAQVEWAPLARLGHTLCIYMGLGRLEAITKALVEAGMPPDRPAAAISGGTSPRQRVVEGDLATLPTRVREAGLEPPAMVVIGPVAAMRGGADSGMRWFERRPLFGQRILVTRTRPQAGELRALLEERGASVHEAPAIRLESVTGEDADRLREALSGLERDPPAWVVFTSANGVRAVFAHLRGMGRDARVFAGARIAVIGSGTADALRTHGLEADHVPASFDSVTLGTELLTRGGGAVTGRRVLLLRADAAGEALPENLRAAGVVVEDVTAYRIVAAEGMEPETADMLGAGAMDWVLFASAGTVRAFFRMLPGEARKAVAAHPPRWGCIGPVTAAALRAEGYEPDVEAAPYTLAALVEAVAEATMAAEGARGAGEDFGAG